MIEFSKPLMIDLIFCILLIIQFGLCYSSNFDLSKLDECDDDSGAKNISNNNFIPDELPEFWPIGVKRARLVLFEPNRSTISIIHEDILADWIVKKPRLAVTYEKSGILFTASIPNFDRLQDLDNSRLSMPFENDKNSDLLFFGLHSTHQEIIQKEIEHCRFKQARSTAYRRILELISANDLDGFQAYENEFNAIFKISCFEDFSKGNFENQLLKFVILFGATKFAGLIACNLNSLAMLTFDIFRYLIETKPLRVALEVIFQTRVTISSIYKASLVKYINRKYQQMDYFMQKAMQLIDFEAQMICPWRPLLVGGTDSDVFFSIYEFLLGYSFKPIMIFAEIVQERLDLFMLSTPAIRFRFLAMLVRLDRADILRTIYELDNSIISYAGNVQRDDNSVYDLFDCCALFSSVDSFRYLLSIDRTVLCSRIGKSFTTLELLMNSDFSLMQIIYEFDFSYNVEIVDKASGISYNLIQLAFLNGRHLFLRHFVERFGKEIVARTIFARWPTANNQIIQSISKSYDCAMLNFCTEFLGLNLKALYEYDGKRGDALIFVSPSRNHIARELRAMGLTGVKKRRIA